MVKRIIDKINRFCIAFYHHSTKQHMLFCGDNVVFENNVRIDLPQFLSINRNTHISRDFRIHFVKNDNFSPQCIIGQNCYIGPNCHITCGTRIEIADEVLIASNCFIGDTDHNFLNPNQSIRESGVISKGDIRIGKGSWVGANVCILSNVHIGQHCVIGAGSVVTKSIPDFSVVAGNPAKIIKKLL